MALSSESVLISPSPPFNLDKMASPTYCPSYHQDRVHLSRSMSTMLGDLILELVRISTLYLLDKALRYISFNCQIRSWFTNSVSSRANQHIGKNFSKDQEKGQQLVGLCPAVQGEGGLPLLDLAPRPHLCYHDRCS